MPLDLQYDILNDAPASASPVEANLNRIENYVNLEVIVRDGSVAMTGQLKLAGDPVSALDAATKQYVDQFLPIGIIMMFGGAAAPPGGRWAMCNGAELESALYPALYQAIARNWTLAAVPAGRFNLPNFNDRVPVGVGATTAIGATGGSRAGVVVAHTHSIIHNHASFVSGGHSVNHTHTFSDTSSSTSSGGAHVHGPNGGSGADRFLNWKTTGGGIGTSAAGSNMLLDTDTASAGTHTHTVAVSGTTSGANVSHTHTIDIPNLPATNSGAASGAIAAADVANANMPPYLGVPHIIRIA